jgi:hypothetical protein
MLCPFYLSLRIINLTCPRSKDQPLIEFSDHKALWNRRPAAQGTMRPEAIVFPPPALDKDFRFRQRISCLAVKQFTPELPDEGLDFQGLGTEKWHITNPIETRLAIVSRILANMTGKCEIGATL